MVPMCNQVLTQEMIPKDELDCARECVGVVSATNEHIGAHAAGVRGDLADGGVQCANSQVGICDYLPHLFVGIMRIAQLVDLRLHAARRDDDAGEEQGGGRDICGRGLDGWSWCG